MHPLHFQVERKILRAKPSSDFSLANMDMTLVCQAKGETTHIPLLLSSQLVFRPQQSFLIPPSQELSYTLEAFVYATLISQLALPLGSSTACSRLSLNLSPFFLPLFCLRSLRSGALSSHSASSPSASPLQIDATLTDWSLL